MNWNDCLARSERVAARTLGDETFIVSPSDSTLHRLPNQVATRIWQLADGRHTLRQIHRQLCEEYQVEPEVAERDMEEFVATLTARGLARLGPCGGVGPA